MVLPPYASNTDSGSRIGSHHRNCGHCDHACLGSLPEWNHTTAIGVVFPKTLRGLSGLDGSVDADRRRGMVILRAVVTDDHPLTICPLHDFRMVDFAQPA